MRRILLALAAWIGLLALPAYARDTVYYYYTDALHSAVVETDANGVVLERTNYGPYGQVLNRSMRDGPGYTGHQEDPGTGLVYMQQRYYDPESGRFLSTDPVQAGGNGESFNRYAYADDNPYRYVDPFGTSSQKAAEKVQEFTQEPCTGSHTHCPSETRIIQLAPRSPPSSKIASQMASNNPGDRVAAAHSAMDYFGIKPSAGTVDIEYDRTLPARIYGETVYDTSRPGYGTVTLGPSAYVTWAHLGSTLGHEIEVHWNQQMLPFMRNAGTSHEFDRWEMAAYMYNIKNAARFGNSAADVDEFRRNYELYKYDLEHRPDMINGIAH